MLPKPTKITEQVFHRFLQDVEAQHEIGTAWQKRNNNVQRLLAKMHLLSEAEFDAALSTVEAMVDGFAQKKAKSEKKQPGNPDRALEQVDSAIQNQRRSA